MMLQQPEPDDYVIATGETNTVQRLVEVAFDQAGVPWEDHVRIDERFLRPAEVEHLIGDPTKARDKLGWVPKTTFEEMVKLMVDSDLELLARGVPQKQAG